MKTTEVAIAVRRRCDEALFTAFSKLSAPIPEFSPTSYIVLKPSIYDPMLVGNTDYELVRALVRMFSSACDVKIVESANPRRTAHEAFQKSGYERLRSERVDLVDLTSSELVPVSLAGHALKTLLMPSLIVNSNAVLVNVPTLKIEPTLSRAGIGLKNLFGLIPERDKSVYHSQLDMVVLDLLTSFRPALTILDLTDVVIGERTQGVTQHMGGVIIGRDPVAVDSYCLSLLGIDPMCVPCLRMAHELGLGEALIDRIRVIGTDHQLSLLTDAFSAIRRHHGLGGIKSDIKFTREDGPAL